MGEWYFLTCRKCETAEWIPEEDLPEYIQDHEGHHIGILTPSIRQENEDFRIWFLKLMGWPCWDPVGLAPPVEEEADDERS